jgi:DNA-binding response OmpR family regulator
MTAAPRQIVVVDDEPDLRSLLGDYPSLQGFAALRHAGFLVALLADLPAT